MPTLTSDRLILRPWRDDDADFVLDLYSRIEVQRYIGAVPTLLQTREEALARITRWRELRHPLATHLVHQIWAVELTDSHELVGTLLLKSIPASPGTSEASVEAGPSAAPGPSGDTEIGWHFHPEHWGNGYAAEAASAVLAHAFAAGLDRVVAVTNPANLASQRVCTRIGMTHLGPTEAYYGLRCELFEIRA